MNSSTISHNKRPIKIWAIIVWILIWQIISITIGQEILLVSPTSVIVRLMDLINKYEFWQAILFSLNRIIFGFLLALILGCVFATIAHSIKLVSEFLEPLILVMKSTPIASFIILCLIWIPTKNLAIFVSFIMVFPIIYTNMYEGINSIDRKLLEMANVFKIPLIKRIRYIYISQTMPYLRSACMVSLGLSWKSGIAAELIGKPVGSIGEALYQAKIYLDTGDVFAWTIVIICASMIFEKLFLYLLNKFIKIAERM